MEILHFALALIVLIPLLQIRHHRRSWENVHGLTLRKEATEHGNYCINDITPYFLDPCLNCRWYIESRGGKPGNFKVGDDANGEGRKEGEHYEAGT